MSKIQEKLSAFIGSERGRFSVRHNNIFSIGFSHITRYHEFLLIIFERYREASQEFVENTRKLQSLIKPGLQKATQEHLTLHAESQSLTIKLHLEIESFYLFAKILLDKIARADDRYAARATTAVLLQR